MIVCFGLNDVNGELEDYLGALSEIFQKCKDNGADVIFMTPNMFNTYVAPDTPEQFREYAAKTAQMQNSGRLDHYMESAISLARDMGVGVCDCYAKWKKLYADGVDTTALLSNRINHPTPEMHELFADALFDLIITNPSSAGDSEDGMYQQ